MAQINGEQMLSEMDSYLNEVVSADAEADSALPFETLDDYLGEPSGFGDVTAKLWKKVSAVFDLASKYNRHSSDYLKCCAQLERGIKFLGSSCLQKYALEQKKHIFPELGELNTANLYTMASIHFNKIDRALGEYMEQKQAVNDALLDMEYRYYHLMERIRATEVKIHNYDDKRFYGEEDYAPVIHGLAFSEKSWSKDIHKSDEPMAFQRARAFSAPHPENEKRRMKNEETTGAVTSAASLPKNEEGTNKREDTSSSSSTCQREQLNKTGSRRKVAEEIHSSPSSPSSDGIISTTGSRQPASLPPFVEIMQRVMERSKDADDRSLTFTFEEIEFLARDPLFAHFEPEMAADIRKILAKGPPI